MTIGQKAQYVVLFATASLVTLFGFAVIVVVVDHVAETATTEVCP